MVSLRRFPQIELRGSHLASAVITAGVGNYVEFQYGLPSIVRRTVGANDTDTGGYVEGMFYRFQWQLG